MNWYLINTKPNAHSLAIQNLKRQGYEVFLPLMIKTSKRRGKFVNSETPLFPGYLFIGTKLSQIPWQSINATRGVSKAVNLDGQYRAVDNQIIDGIRSRCNHNDVFKTVDKITSGDRVKIEKGPFMDFICNVDKIAADQRAWLLIDILQQKIRAKISMDDLSKID